ncbi:MAG: aromatic amino acid transport family protein [Candidatus Kerfeldbacteria bacterium]
MNVKQHAAGAIALLIGTAIGAGIFGIPYVVAQSGVVFGLMHILLLALVSVVTLLAYATVVLRTTGIHQFPGYARQYLGRAGQIVAFLSLIFGMYAALVAYTVETGHFLFIVFQPYFGGSELIYALIFWGVGTAVIFTGLGLVTRFEQVIVISIVFVIVLLAVIGIPHIETAELLRFNGLEAFLPYGVILFAFGAASSIPEIRRYLVKRHALHAMPKVIWIGMGVTAAIYAIFAVIVVGISGLETTESAVVGLGSEFGSVIIWIGAVFGILAMGSSFLIIGLALKQMYQYDFGRSKITALTLALGIPLIIYLMDLASFVEILSIAGAITGGFQGIIIWQMLRKTQAMPAQRKPEYTFNVSPWAIWTVQIIFVLGIVYECLILTGLITL